MPALAGRIKRLETVTGARLTPCPTCGRLPNGLIPSRHRQLRATFDPPETLHCPRCGALTVYVLTLESATDAPA